MSINNFKNASLPKIRDDLKAKYGDQLDVFLTQNSSISAISDRTKITVASEKAVNDVVKSKFGSQHDVFSNKYASSHSTGAPQLTAGYSRGTKLDDILKSRFNINNLFSKYNLNGIDSVSEKKRSLTELEEELLGRTKCPRTDETVPEVPLEVIDAANLYTFRELNAYTPETEQQGLRYSQWQEPIHGVLPGNEEDIANLVSDSLGGEENRSVESDDPKNIEESELSLLQTLRKDEDFDPSKFNIDKKQSEGIQPPANDLSRQKQYSFGHGSTLNAQPVIHDIFNNITEEDSGEYFDFVTLCTKKQLTFSQMLELPMKALGDLTEKPHTGFTINTMMRYLPENNEVQFLKNGKIKFHFKYYLFYESYFPVCGKNTKSDNGFTIGKILQKIKEIANIQDPELDSLIELLTERKIILKDALSVLETIQAKYDKMENPYAVHMENIPDTIIPSNTVEHPLIKKMMEQQEAEILDLDEQQAWFLDKMDNYKLWERLEYPIHVLNTLKDLPTSISHKELYKIIPKNFLVTRKNKTLSFVYKNRTKIVPEKYIDTHLSKKLTDRRAGYWPVGVLIKDLTLGLSNPDLEDLIGSMQHPNLKFRPLMNDVLKTLKKIQTDLKKINK